MTIRYVRWVATTGRYRELKNMRGTYKIMIASALLFAVLSLTVAVAQTADDAEGADPVFVIIDNVKYKISGSEAEAVKCTNPYLETNFTILPTVNHSGVDYPVKKIGPGAFEESGALSVTIPDGIVSIGASAFRECGIKSARIPSSVTQIGDIAFYRSEITTVTIEGNPTFGTGVFQETFSLNAAIMPNVEALGVSAFDRGKIKVAFMPMVKTIGARAFAQCGQLVSVVMPEVRIVGSEGFDSCAKLVSVTMPKAESLEFRAFAFCYALRSATLPDSAVVHWRAFESDNSFRNMTVIVGSNAVADGVVRVFLSAANLKRVILAPASADVSVSDAITYLKARTPNSGATVIDLDGTVWKYSGGWSVRPQDAVPTMALFDPNFPESTRIMVWMPNALNDIPFTHRPGYVLSGWFSDSVGGTPIAYGHSNSSDIKAYAHWNEAQFKVRYNPVGGTGSMPDTTVPCNGTYTFPANGFTSPAGHVFIGWSLKGLSKVYSAGDTLEHMSVTDAEIVDMLAVWRGANVSVSYGGAHGSVLPASAFTAAQFDCTLTPVDFHKCPDAITVTMGGAAFSDFTYNSVTGAISIGPNLISGDIVITGDCVPKTYSITLKPYAEVGSESFEAAYGCDTLSGYVAPSRAGGVFEGYWSSQDGGVMVITDAGNYVTDAAGFVENGKWALDGTCTLYAKWSGDLPPGPDPTPHGSTDVAVIVAIVAALVVATVIVAFLLLRKKGTN